MISTYYSKYVRSSVFFLQEGMSITMQSYSLCMTLAWHQANGSLGMISKQDLHLHVLLSTSNQKDESQASYHMDNDRDGKIILLNVHNNLLAV